MGDPRAARLRDALGRKDWPAARDILDGTRHPDDRAFYLEVAGTTPGVQEWIADWAATDTLAQLVRGCHAVAWAWDARGRSAAEYTRDDQFRLFFERLRLAEACLYDVTTRDPDESAAWAFLVRTARGLQLPVDDGRFRFDQAVRRHPGHLKAHFEMMQTLCKKWGGSHDQMRRFAHETAERSPAGSMLPHLVAMARLEITVAGDGLDGRAHMRRPDVRAEVRTAAEQSIWSAAAEYRPGWPLYVNTFAMAFIMGDDLSAAADAFERIGELATMHPWVYLGASNPAEQFADARKRALAYRRLGG